MAKKQAKRDVVEEKSNALQSLEKLKKQLKEQIPEECQNITANRARRFLMLLNEIGIGDIINSVVREDKGEEQMFKPVTMSEQIAGSSRHLRSADNKIRDVQLHIDFSELTKRLLEGKNFDELVCVVMDVENADDANFGRFGDVFPFFCYSFSRLYAGLTSFIVQSV